MQTSAYSDLSRANIIKEGWLQKKSPKGYFVRPWQNRYFILFERILLYYKDKPPADGPLTAEQGNVPMNAISGVLKQNDKKQKGRFEIRLIGDEGRTFELQADTEQEEDEWVNHIERLKGGAPMGGGDPRAHAATAGKFWKDRPVEVSQKVAHSHSAVDASPVAHTLFSDASDVSSSAPPLINLRRVEEQFEFGHQYHAEDRLTLAPLLVHAIQLRDRDRADACFQQMSELQHPYIFQQLHIGRTSDFLFAVYTRSVEPSLWDLKLTHNVLPYDVVVLFAAELVLAIECLHSFNTLFRNMCAENIILDSDGHIFISDLLLFADSTLASEAKLEFATPESLSGQEETEASDCWRLGVLLYLLLVGFPPFRRKSGEDAAALKAKILSYQPSTLRFPARVPTLARQFIANLLNPNPMDRVGAVESLRSHPFFAEVDWVRLYNRQVHTLPWVDEVVLKSRRRQAIACGRTDPTKIFQLVAGVIQARGLPGLHANGELSDVFVSIRINDGEMACRTSLIKDTVTPQWDSYFNINLSKPGGYLHFDVCHQESEDNYVPIGSIAISLQQMAEERKQEAWLPIVGGDAIGYGELYLSLNFIELVNRVRIEPSTNTHQSFTQYFRLGDWDAVVHF